jgi:hypothetical protein
MANDTRTIIDEIERVPKHLVEVLTMLEKWQKLLDNDLDSISRRGKMPPAGMAKQLSDIAKTSKPIAQELRAWVDKVIEVNQSLSLGDKLKVSLKLIQSLSAGDRYKFYEMVNEHERGRSDGGIKLVVTKI